MLREVSEIRNETREALENNVMGYISDAARRGEYDVKVPTREVPSWLDKKLTEHGYKITRTVSDTLIYWGYNDAQ